MKKCILLFLIFCVLTTHTVICAEETAKVKEGEEVGVGDAVGEAEDIVDDAAEKAALDKAERRRAATEKRQLLESCLVLIRASYSKNSGKPKFFENFLKDHPTKEKNTLQSKIMSQMMLKCKGEINLDQVAQLQVFRVRVEKMTDTADLESLIDIDWEALRHKAEPEAEKPKEAEKTTEEKKKVDVSEDPDAEEKEALNEDDEPEVEAAEPEKPKEAEAPQEVKITLTQDEKLMATEIEDISEDLHAEQVQSNRQGAGKTSIAFMDPSSMSVPTQCLFIFFFLAFFAGVGIFFYTHLFNEEQDPRKLKRQALNDARKNDPYWTEKQKTGNKKKR